MKNHKNKCATSTVPQLIISYVATITKQRSVRAPYHTIHRDTRIFNQTRLDSIKKHFSVQLTGLAVVAIQKEVSVTCKGIVHALRSHTLKFRWTSLSREPTSHNPISPTLVPTEEKVVYKIAKHSQD